MRSRRSFIISKELLQTLYVEQGLTIGAISKLLGCDSSVTSKYLKIWAIPVRSHSETIGGRKRTESSKLANLSRDELNNLYNVRWLTTTEIGKRYNCTGGIVLAKLEEYGIPQHTSRIRGMDKTNLKRLYVKEGQSAIQIGETLGVSNAAVLKALKRYGIPIRNRSEAGKNKIFTPEHLEKLRLEASTLNKGKFGKDHPGWKGDGSAKKIIDSYGYVLIRVYDDKEKGKYIREHRYVMQQHLGHILNPWDEVNHINGVKTDNSLENLEVIPNEHKRKDWLRTHPDWNKSESKPQS